MTCTTRLLATALVVLLSSAALAYFIKLPLRLLASILRRKSENKRQLILGKLSASSVQDAIIVGFFHPYCNAGGGGERVLWAAIRATQDKYPNVMCVVYTGDQDASEATIISQVEHRFDIKLDPERLNFMYLSTRHWVAASFWPQFTLLGQSLGPLVLAYDAFSLLCPD
ncbi:asparagine-linked glycosylation protein, partial [Rhizina undulata]